MTILVLLLANGIASANSVSCPAFIEDQQVISTQVAPGTVTYRGKKRRLEYMAVFSGHPSRRQQIRGDNWSNKHQESWNFSAKNDTWIECTYRNSSAVITFHVGNAKGCLLVQDTGDILGGKSGICRKAAP